MNIQALVFDLDGTAIPNKPDGRPSVRLIDTVNKARKSITVSIATGRPISNSKHIFKDLNITSPSVISGGTQIYDPSTNKILWEKKIPRDIVEIIINLIRPFEYGVYISDDEVMKKATEIVVNQDERIIYLMAVTERDTSTILEKIKNVKDIVAHKVKSWTEGHFDIHITHKDATKKHAIEELLKMIQVSKDKLMVVGDSDNDLPLFESGGFRVAMGNGSDNLKKQAHHITDSVENDGLALAIEKFILSIK